MSEMIEQVAKGIYGSVAMDTFNDLSDDELHAMARAAIEAMRDSELTWDMRGAAVNVTDPGPGEPPLYEKIWRAMITAALSPSREDEGK